MNEEEAQQKIRERFGTVLFERTREFLDMVIAENQHQNLIAASTIPQIWARHAFDSLQLVAMAGDRKGLWIDIGSGGGFPGVPVALAWDGPVLLVEPRRRRADFLAKAIDRLALGAQASVLCGRIETVQDKAAILSARAVAGIEPLLDMAQHCGGPDARWLLPRGHIGDGEIAALRRRWSFMFHVEHSGLDPASLIAVLDGVKLR